MTMQESGKPSLGRGKTGDSFLLLLCRHLRRFIAHIDNTHGECALLQGEASNGQFMDAWSPTKPSRFCSLFWKSEEWIEIGMKDIGFPSDRFGFSSPLFLILLEVAHKILYTGIECTAPLLHQKMVDTLSLNIKRNRVCGFFLKVFKSFFSLWTKMLQERTCFRLWRENGNIFKKIHSWSANSRWWSWNFYRIQKF